MMFKFLKLLERADVCVGIVQCHLENIRSSQLTRMLYMQQLRVAVLRNLSHIQSEIL